jgi:hypothetical protein
MRRIRNHFGAANDQMLHLNIDPEHVNRWLLNIVMFGFFLLEMALTGYIIYLVVHRIPH